MITRQPKTIPAKKVLIVESDFEQRQVLERMIRLINPFVHLDWTNRAETAIRLLQENQPSGALSGAQLGSFVNSYDIVLSDITLAGKKTGVDLVSDCQRKKISAYFILTSENDEFKTLHPFISRPFKFEEVEACFAPILQADDAPDEVPPFGFNLLIYAHLALRAAKLKFEARFNFLVYLTGGILLAWLSLNA